MKKQKDLKKTNERNVININTQFKMDKDIYHDQINYIVENIQIHVKDLNKIID